MAEVRHRVTASGLKGRIMSGRQYSDNEFLRFQCELMQRQIDAKQATIDLIEAINFKLGILVAAAMISTIASGIIAIAITAS